MGGPDPGGGDIRHQSSQGISTHRSCIVAGKQTAMPISLPEGGSWCGIGRPVLGMRADSTVVRAGRFFLGEFVATPDFGGLIPEVGFASWRLLPREPRAGHCFSRMRVTGGTRNPVRRRGTPMRRNSAGEVPTDPSDPDGTSRVFCQESLQGREFEGGKRLSGQLPQQVDFGMESTMPFANQCGGNDLANLGAEIWSR